MCTSTGDSEVIDADLQTLISDGRWIAAIRVWLSKNAPCNTSKMIHDCWYFVPDSYCTRYETRKYALLRGARKVAVFNDDESMILSVLPKQKEFGFTGWLMKQLKAKGSVNSKEAAAAFPDTKQRMTLAKRLAYKLGIEWKVSSGEWECIWKKES